MLTVFIPKFPNFEAEAAIKLFYYLIGFGVFFPLGSVFLILPTPWRRRCANLWKEHCESRCHFKLISILKRFKGQRNLKSWFQYFISAVSPSGPQESAQLLKMSSASVERHHQITWKNYRPPAPSAVWVFTNVHFVLNPSNDFDSAVRHTVCLPQLPCWNVITTWHTGCERSDCIVILYILMILI